MLADHARGRVAGSLSEGRGTVGKGFVSVPMGSGAEGPRDFFGALREVFFTAGRAAVFFFGRAGARGWVRRSSSASKTFRALRAVARLVPDLPRVAVATHNP